MERLNSIIGISCLKPQGAFYVFSDISEILGRAFKGQSIKDDLFLSEIFLAEARVAVVPGSAFGTDDNLRVSYATSMEKIIEGLNCIEEFVNKLV